MRYPVFNSLTFIILSAIYSIPNAVFSADSDIQYWTETGVTDQNKDRVERALSQASGVQRAEIDMNTGLIVLISIKDQRIDQDEVQTIGHQLGVTLAKGGSPGTNMRMPSAHGNIDNNQNKNTESQTK